MTTRDLSRSHALWNRHRFDPASDEQLAQLLDRGEMWAWRELYRLAQRDRELRRRLYRIVRTVPIALPHFWLAALASLGEEVDLAARLPPGPHEGGRDLPCGTRRAPRDNPRVRSPGQGMTPDQRSVVPDSKPSAKTSDGIVGVTSANDVPIRRSSKKAGWPFI